MNADGGLQAVKIERLDQEAGLPFEFTGIVQKIEDGLWDISGVSIMTDEKTTLSEGIKAGDLVLVKGRIQVDGSWLAQKITLASAVGSRIYIYRESGK